MYWPSLSQYVWNISTKLRTLRITSLKYPTYIVEENKKYFQLMGGMKYPFSGYHLLQRIKLKTTYCGLFALEISDMRIPVNLNLKLTISGFVIHASHLLTEQTSIIQFLDVRRMSFNETIKVLCLKKK